MTPPSQDRLTARQFSALAMLRNGLSIAGRVHGRTIRSLRDRGLLERYSLEITDKGQKVMDSYGEASESA